MAMLVQVRGEFGGAVGSWRPAITGTLNQTGRSDYEASLVASHEEAHDLLVLLTDAGVADEDVRAIEVQS